MSETILHHQKIDACFEAVKFFSLEPTLLSYKIVAKTDRENTLNIEFLMTFISIRVTA